MHINKRILAGLIILMPPIFWILLFEGYELPKWFLWRWGMLFIFLIEILFFARNDRKKNREKPKILMPVFLYPWFAFFFFSFLSLGGAVNFQLGLLNIANLFLGFSLFFFISNYWDESEVKSLIPLLVLPALPVAVYGIFQAFGHDFVHLAGPFRGAISTFGHRNFVAEYELMVLPLLMYGGFFFTGKYNFRLVQIFSLISLPIVYTHFIITHTRGSYIALIAALLFMVVFVVKLPQGFAIRNNKRRRWFSGTVVLFLLLTGLFLWRNFNIPGERVIGENSEIISSVQNNNPPRSSSPPQGGGDKEETQVEPNVPSSLYSRILIWRATLALFRSHPIVGIGAGNLNEAISPYYSQELLQRFKGRIEAGTSHNDYMQILAETGLIGGISFFLFLAFLLRFAGRVSWRMAKEKAEFLPLFLTAGILGILTASLISSPLLRPMTLFLFYLFIGLLVVFGREEARSLSLSRKVQERVLVGFVLILGVSAYSFAWLAVQADFYGQKSFNEFRIGNRKQAVLDVEKALNYQPQDRRLLIIAGNTYLNAGRFEEAIRSYGQVVAYHPYSPEGYGNLGLALAQAGFPAEAEKYLNYSLRLDPYQPLVYNTLGTVYAQQNKFQEAKEEFLKALAIDPDLIFLRLNLQEMEKKTK